MQYFLFFEVISLIASVSLSHQIKSFKSGNTISSLDDVITISTTETIPDTGIWDEFSTYNTTDFFFTDISTMPTDTTSINTINTTLDTEVWNDISTYHSTTFVTESSYILTDTTNESDILHTSESNNDYSTEVFLTVTSANFTTAMSSFVMDDVSKSLDNNSSTESSVIFTSALPFLFASPITSSLNTTPTEAHEQKNTTMEPYTTGYFKSSTAVSESSSRNSISMLSSWISTTYAMNFTPDVIQMGDNKPALNTIETETDEPKGPKCGQKFSRIPRIIGGIRSLAGEFPWMVSVRVLTAHYCGGVIINKDWILTAGHCVRRFAARYWRIRLGGHDVNIDQFRPQWDIPVSKVILHPKFGSPARYSYDMALLKLQRSIKYTDFAAPICLPENLEETFDGVNATVVGWGRTNESVEETTPFLQKVFIPIVNNSLCAEWYRKVHYGYIRVRDHQICAGLREGGKDACKGDSGGPLVMEDKHGRYTLLGITSAGVGCGRSQLPGIYSRTTYFVPWILKITGGYTHWPSEDDYDDY